MRDCGVKSLALLGRKVFCSLALFCLPATLWAASAGVELEKFHGDAFDLPSLQRGAATYMNYCLGCHSLRYQRYNRVADDLKIPKKLFVENLITNSAQIGEHIKTSMDPEIAKHWFGSAPPDLTMVTRVRSPDWVYSYLKSFYQDDSRPFGVNNQVFPNVGMPHALLELQGVLKKGCREVPKIAANGGEARDPFIPSLVLTETRCGFLNLEEGSGLLNAEEYDLVVTDLVNFLHYVAEPSRQDRERIGGFVLLYLAILFVFTWLLNREYWRGIH